MPDKMELHCTAVQESNRRLKLVFSLITKPYTELSATSNEFKVGCYALMRFKFRFAGSSSVATSVSLKLHPLQAHTNIQINVTCNGQVKQFVCPQLWSDFLEINDNSRCIFDRSVIKMFAIPIEITVDTSIPTPWSSLHSNDSFTDFHLSSETGSVSVHRVVMAHHSEVFETMLNGEWKETAKHCLAVEGVSQQTLQHLKDYMYLGSLPGHEDLRPLLLIAKCYMMQHLEEACSDKLVQTVKPENLLDLVKFAMDNQLSELILSIIEHTSQQVISSAREATVKSKMEKIDE